MIWIVKSVVEINA